MKNGEFPIGNPKVFTQTDGIGNGLPWTSPLNNKYKGFLLVTILPPKELRYPLLPYRTENKKNKRLVFCLCATCAEEGNVNICRHTDAQRSWTTGYTHLELNKALELGYVVLEVHEIWHYESWADEKKFFNGLFNEYINTFLKWKVEASGYPSHVRTEEDVDKFINDYFEKEGLNLDKNNIEKNSVLRFISKVFFKILIF